MNILKELMVGNVIHKEMDDLSLEPRVVSAVSRIDVSLIIQNCNVVDHTYSGDDLKNIKPIKTTKEFLETYFGFKPVNATINEYNDYKKSTIDFKLSNHSFFVRFTSESIKKRTGWVVEETTHLYHNDTEIFADISYIHRLQNAIFFFTRIKIVNK